MDPVRNPYAPGAGRAPAALVGRQEQLDSWDVALRRIEAGRDAQSVVLYGLRGVGKTVLLTRFAATARDRSWLVAQVEAKSGATIRDAIGEAFHDNLVDLARPGVGHRVLKALKTALSFKASYDSTGKWSFGLDLDSAAGGGADTGGFESDLGKLLRDLSAAAEEKGVGVAVLVDEAQDLARDELIALCSIVHAANQRGDRLVVALAGLPSLPRKLAEAKSYAERLFDFHPVGALDAAAAAAALAEPAQAERVTWAEDALEPPGGRGRRLPVLPPAVRAGGVERRGVDADHAGRRAARGRPRAARPGQRVLPRPLGPRDALRAGVPAGHGRRRRRRQRLGRGRRAAGQEGHVAGPRAGRA